MNDIKKLLTELEVGTILPIYEDKDDSIPMIEFGKVYSIEKQKDLGTVVYFLYNKGELVYVGSTSSFFTRLGNHLETKVFDSFKVIPTTVEDRWNDEAKYIFELSPKYNKKLPQNDIYYTLSKVISEFKGVKKNYKEMFELMSVEWNGFRYIIMNDSIRNYIQIKSSEF